MLRKISQASTTVQNTITGTRYRIKCLYFKKKCYIQHFLSFSFLSFKFLKIGFALKIVAWMDKMVQKCPEMVSHIKIRTVEDNPLYVLKVKTI